MSESVQPLSSLPMGGRGAVAEINAASSSRARLLELGFLVGTPVELVRYAPLGDPVEVRLRGYLLTLRKHEADLIQVRVAP